MRSSIRILLIAVVAALTLTTVVSGAEARYKKPGAVAKPSNCKVDEYGTLDHGDELLVEGQYGDVHIYSCNNGTVCVKIIDKNGEQTNADGDCWYDPASWRPGSVVTGAIGTTGVGTTAARR